MSSSLRIIGFPLWYFFPVALGGVLSTFPNMVLISGYPQTDNAGSFLLCFWACMLSWLVGVSVRHTRDENGQITTYSLLGRMVALFLFLILPVHALAFYSYVGYDYPLVSRPQSEGGVYSIYGVESGFTKVQVMEVWGTPSSQSKDHLAYYPSGRRVSLTNGVVTKVVGDRLERNGVPILGMGAHIADVEEVLGPGIKSDDRGGSFRIYPLRGLDVAPCNFKFPFMTEYTIVPGPTGKTNWVGEAAPNQ